MSKNQYKVSIGAWKSIKNVLIIWGIPALALLIENWVDWIPNEYHQAAIPIMGLIAYFTKNYIQNK